jgi:hypothetical protein
MAENNPAVATVEQSRLIANDVGHNAGIAMIVILEIAQIAIPLLIKLFSSCQSTLPATATSDDKSAEMKAYLANVYDQDSKSFPPFVIRKCRPQVRQSAIQSGQQYRGIKQLNAITTATLIRGMNSDQATVSALVSEAAHCAIALAPDDDTDQTEDDGSNPPVVI